MNTTYVRMPTNKQLLTMGLPDLPEDAFGGIGPRLTPIARAIGGKQPALYGGGGGGLKAVVAVAAAIAVPYFAPAIASSIGLSAAVTSAIGVSAATGAAIGSAIVGAGLGAITAAATGRDVGRGALFGSLSSGLTGYASVANAPTAAGGATTTTAGGATTTTAAGGGVPSVGGTQVFNDGSTLQVFDDGSTLTMATDGTFTSTAATDIGSQLSGASPAGLDTATAPVAGSSAPQTFNDGSSIQTFDDGSTLATAADGSVTSSAATAPVAGGGVQTAGGGVQTTSTIDKLTTGVKNVGSEIAKKFTDPKQQADLLLKAAGQIAGSYIAGDGVSDEEKQLLNQQRQELENLRATNQELFKEKLEAARSLVQGANYFDPEYFGLQRARQVQQAGAKVERERLAGIDPRRANLRAAEQRRTRLATGRDVGTAYDTGFTAAVDAQNRSRTAGLNLYPTAPSSMGYAQNLMGMYDTADRRKRQAQSDIGSLFGSITGGSAARST